MSKPYTNFLNSVWEKATTIAKIPKESPAVPIGSYCQAYLSLIPKPEKDIRMVLSAMIIIFSDPGDSQQREKEVSHVESERFIQRFGPPEKSIEKILDILVKGRIWFYGRISAETASTVLTHSPAEGKFLVRYGGSIPDSFTIDFLKDANTPSKFTVFNDYEGDGVKMQQGPGKILKFKSFSQFLAKNNKIFKVPATTETPTSFQWLKMQLPDPGAQNSQENIKNNNNNNNEDNNNDNEDNDENSKWINIDKIIEEEGCKKYWKDFEKEITENNYNRLFELLNELLLRIKKILSPRYHSWLNDILNISFIQNSTLDANEFFSIFHSIWDIIKSLHSPDQDQSWIQWHNQIVQDIAATDATWSKLLPNIFNHFFIALDRIQHSIHLSQPFLKQDSLLKH